MASTDIFAPALDQLSPSFPVFGPTGFQDYAEAHGLAAGKTADRISINHWGQLPASLKAANVMVFRLGAGKAGRTNFSLVAVDDVRDFFLSESAVEQTPPRTFLSNARMRDLVGYTMLGPSETTLINLAFASGLIASALGLDDHEPLPAPARGVTRASFEFRPHRSLGTVLRHSNGQVEIDAIFIGRRNGADLVFVIEAKQSTQPLAKHKLVYPVLALAPELPPDIPIVPVYLQAERDRSGYQYVISECSLDDPRSATVEINSLSIVRTQRLRLPLGG